MKALFINGSPNPKGATARLAETLLAGRPHETVELGTTKVYDYGQSFDDDQFDEVLAKMRAADLLVLGSPVYWHDLSGMLRNLLDRCYGPVEEGDFAGKRLVFIFQGASPTKEMFERAEYTMRRFAGLYGAEYLGMVTTEPEAKAMARRL